MKRIFVNRRNYKKIYLVLLVLIVIAIFLNVFEVLGGFKYAIYGGVWGLSIVMFFYHLGNLIHFKNLIETDDRYKGYH